VVYPFTETSYRDPFILNT